MTNSSTKEIIRAWVADFVIKLNLCPFAKHPFSNGQIRFAVLEGEGLEKIIELFWEEILHLEKEGKDAVSNSILILPEYFKDFEDYLLLIEMCEDLLELQQKEEDFQIASFHPDYQFAGCERNDPRNFTNRSPFPLIHILRSEEIEKAIEYHPDTLKIPEDNAIKLQEIGSKNLGASLLKYSKK